jgi:hypothetical protein
MRTMRKFYKYSLIFSFVLILAFLNGNILAGAFGIIKHLILFSIKSILNDSMSNNEDDNSFILFHFKKEIDSILKLNKFYNENNRIISQQNFDHFNSNINIIHPNKNVCSIVPPNLSIKN